MIYVIREALRAAAGPYSKTGGQEEPYVSARETAIMVLFTIGDIMNADAVAANFSGILCTAFAVRTGYPCTGRTGFLMFEGINIRSHSCSKEEYWSSSHLSNVVNGGYAHRVNFQQAKMLRKQGINRRIRLSLPYLDLDQPTSLTPKKSQVFVTGFAG